MKKIPKYMSETINKLLDDIANDLEIMLNGEIDFDFQNEGHVSNKKRIIIDMPITKKKQVIKLISSICIDMYNKASKRITK